MSATDRPTVFVVDDDTSVRESLRWLLESVDLDVETFETAEAFLSAYSPGRSGCQWSVRVSPGMIRSSAVLAPI